MSATQPETQPTPQPAPPPASGAHLNAAGDMNVGGDVVSGDQVTVNNTVTINLSGDLLAQLEQIKALSTELTKAAGRQPAAAPPAKPAEALKSVDTALGLLQGTDQAGAPAQELQAGGLQISRAELLLKKAVLLEAEAEELVFDAHQRAGGQTDASGEPQLPADYDDAPRLAKLREAEQLLREVNRQDPANTEMLLHLAQVVSQLTPDNPAEALKLLNRVEQLLSAPKDDVEKFRLAQARYYLASSQDPPDAAGLQEARALFLDLGRHQWVAYVDELLQTGGPEFDPLGQWIIQVDDKAETLIGVELLANGQCEGWQETQAKTKTKTKKGSGTAFAGEWGFDPDQHVLTLQGQFETGRSFELALQLQDQDEDGLYAVDAKGKAYRLSRP